MKHLAFASMILFIGVILTGCGFIHPLASGPSQNGPRPALAKTTVSSSLNAKTSQQSEHSVTMFSYGDGWAFNRKNQLVRTTDMGRHWHEVLTFTGQTHAVTSFRGDNQAVVMALPTNTDAHVISIYTTHNGGKTWSKTHIAQPQSGYTINGTIIWSNKTTGRLLLLQEPPQMNSRLALWQTDDAGLTWTLINPQVLPEVTSFRFVTATTGWAIAIGQSSPSYPFLLKTTDDGRTWIPVPLTIPAPIAVSASTNVKLQNTGTPVSPPVFANPKDGALWVTYMRWQNPRYVNWAVLYDTTDGGHQWHSMIWHQLPNYPSEPSPTIWPLTLHWKKATTGWVLQLQDALGKIVTSYTVSEK